MKNMTGQGMAAKVSMLELTFCSPGLIASLGQCLSPPLLQIVRIAYGGRTCNKAASYPEEAAMLPVTLR